jgi:hypothetical protein
VEEKRGRKKNAKNGKREREREMRENGKRERERERSVIVTQKTQVQKSHNLITNLITFAKMQKSEAFDTFRS